MVVAAERHHAADAEAREHLAIDVLIDRHRQPKARRLEPEPLVVEEEQRAREAEARVHLRRVRECPAVVDHRVVREVLLVDAAFRDGEVFREELRRRAEGLAVGVADERPRLLGEVVVDARVDVVDVQFGGAGREIVLRPGHGIPGLIGQRIVVQHLSRHRIHAIGRNHVVRERIANEAAARRVRPRRERIEDANQLAVLRERLREVAVALRERRHRRGHFRRAVLAQPFVRGHEEGFPTSDRAARDAAELAALKVAERRACLLREVVVLVERGVPEELVGAAVEVVRARLVDDVEDAAQTAAVFRRVVRAHHLELLDGVDRGEHRDAGEAVDRRERRRHAVDDGIHHRRPRAVHAVAHRVVVVADRAGDPRRQEDERVDVAGVERQLLDAPVVDEFADGARCGLQ